MAAVLMGYLRWALPFPRTGGPLRASIRLTQGATDHQKLTGVLRTTIRVTILPSRTVK